MTIVKTIIMITEAAKFYIADLYSPPPLNGKSDKLIRKKKSLPKRAKDGVFVLNKVKNVVFGPKIPVF